jgi:hypothetical protein
LHYSFVALCAKYVQDEGLGFNTDSPPFGGALLSVELGGLAGRIEARAAEIAAASGLEGVALYAAGVRGEYEMLLTEEQRAVGIMADHAEISVAYGFNSPQAKCARNVYAANMAASAMRGIRLPKLEPLATSILDPSISAPPSEVFDERYDGGGLFDIGGSFSGGFGADVVGAAKAKANPDMMTERQMTGPQWDEPKALEVQSILYKLGAAEKVPADDPRVAGMRVVDTMWTGRCKRGPNGEVTQLRARCVMRGDLQAKFYNISSNEKMSPVVRNTSLMSVDAVSCLRGQDFKQSDFTGAYLQGQQTESERTLARPPTGFRESDERGVQVFWLMLAPLYGQCDAGAVWNRTLNEFLTAPGPVGLGFERASNDPCIYSKTVPPNDNRVTYRSMSTTRGSTTTPRQRLAPRPSGSRGG